MPLCLLLAAPAKCCKSLTRGCSQVRINLFSQETRDRRRGNVLKLQQVRFRFPWRAARGGQHWNIHLQSPCSFPRCLQGVCSLDPEGLGGSCGWVCTQGEDAQEPLSPAVGTKAGACGLGGVALGAVTSQGTGHSGSCEQGHGQLGS